MPKLVRVPTPIRMERLTRVLQVRGADVYVHWSVFLIAALMLSAVFDGLWLRWLRWLDGLELCLSTNVDTLLPLNGLDLKCSRSTFIPFFGLTRFERPWSRFADCVIVWGGVLAQAVIAIPIVVLLARYGYSHFESLNALLALFGPYSLMVAVINLLLLRGVDGSRAWKLLPALFEAKSSSNTTSGRWR